MTEIIVVCGPSGVGKSTLIGLLMKEFKEFCKFSVSHTTRPRRPDEEEGTNYYFVTNEKFDKIEFIEKLSFAGNRYGTSKRAITEMVRSGKLPILDVNINSLEQLQRVKDLKMITIFIKPPSLEALNQRLHERAKTTMESEAALKKRFEKAPEEIALCDKLHFNNVLINENLNETYAALKNIVTPAIERIKQHMQNGLTPNGLTPNGLMKFKGITEVVIKVEETNGLLEDVNDITTKLTTLSTK